MYAGGILLLVHHHQQKETFMSTTPLKITAADLCNLATEVGANVQEQKSWFKVTNGENRKALYIAKSKRIVTKVHFAGFVPEESDLIKQLSQEDAKELKLGAVRGELNTKNMAIEVTDDDIKECFESGLEQLFDGTDGFKLGKKKDEEDSEEESEEEADLGTDVDYQAQLAADEE